MYSYIDQIVNGITVNEAKNLCHYLLEEASEIEAASLLTALKVKGHSYESIAGFAKGMKDMATHLDIPKDDYIDVCGTGGDGINTFNISSTVGLLLSKKMHVVKHGNRSVTSKSGSADLYEALGINIPKDKRTMETSIIDNQFTFLFAPFVHPKMKHIMPIRKALAYPTIFNVIGPLCNPVNLKYQVIGVYDEALMLPVSKALLELGLKRAAVIHGHHGMDELSTTGPNKAILLVDGQLNSITIDPKDYNIPYQDLKDLQGGTPEENALITTDILNNRDVIRKDIIALNAGLAFFIGEQATTINEGIKLANALIEHNDLEEITCQYSIK